MKAKNKSIVKAVVAGLISLIAAAGLVVGAVALNRTVTTVELTAWDYKVATLEADGDEDESEAAIVTKNFLPVEDLQIKIDEDAEISYRVFFYDEDEEFISATEALTADFDESAIPEGAKFAKILVTHEDDDEISWSEKGDYIAMLEVSHAR